MKHLVEPEVQQHRVRARMEGGGREVPSILEWMSIHGKNHYETDSDALVNRSILLTMAGSFSIAYSLTFILHDICKYPQFTEDLRQEARACLSGNGRWDRHTLDNMKKIESFMSESQRMHPGAIRKSFVGNKNQ